MPSDTSESIMPVSEERAPRALRWAMLAAVGLLTVGAGFLVAVRGEAMLVDLATFAGKVWCF